MQQLNFETGVRTVNSVLAQSMMVYKVLNDRILLFKEILLIINNKFTYNYDILV